MQHDDEAMAAGQYGSREMQDVALDALQSTDPDVTMEQQFRAELHDMFLRKNGVCYYCKKPITREEDATITHLVTRDGNQPVLVHVNEILQVTMANAGAQGVLGAGWMKRLGLKGAA